MRSATGLRVWIVLVVARPRNGAPELRVLLRPLHELGARRVTAGVFMVRDVEGAGERLGLLADAVSNAGGRVALADSMIVDDREGN